MAESVRYGQSQLMFGDLEIVCDSFKVSFKRDDEDLTATNSSTPYDTQFGKETIEAEASDIDTALTKELKKSEIPLLPMILKRTLVTLLKTMYYTMHMSKR